MAANQLDPTDFPINLPHQFTTWARRKEALERKITNLQELDGLFSALEPKSATPLFLHEYYSSPKREGPRALFFEKILPHIQSLVLKLPELFPTTINHLVPQVDATLILTREQVAALLACAFFRMLPHPGSIYRGRMAFNDVNFDVLFSANADMFPIASGCLCILHYFNRIQEKAPEGNIIIHRKVLKQEDRPKWLTSTKPLQKLQVDHDVNIENDTESCFHADFANEYIGGGVLHGGCVQEEILFLIKPECLVSMLVCPKMDDNESIVISGAERFSNFTGYAHSFRYAGDFVDPTPRNSARNIVRNHVLAMDAVISQQFGYQFREIKLFRDINKAYAAFRDLRADDGNFDENPPVISTGNWGCGAFGGDKKLKAVQQWLAASEAESHVNYHTFKDMPFTESLTAMATALLAKKVNVGQLATALFEFSKLVVQDSFENRDVFKYLRKHFDLDNSDVDKLANDIEKKL